MTACPVAFGHVGPTVYRLKPETGDQIRRSSYTTSRDVSQPWAWKQHESPEIGQAVGVRDPRLWLGPGQWHHRHTSRLDQQL